MKLCGECQGSGRDKNADAYSNRCHKCDGEGRTYNKIFEVNCDKAWTIIYLSLWIGATIGLNYALCFTIIHIEQEGFGSTDEDFYGRTITIPFNMLVFLGAIVCIIANIANDFFLWSVINDHFKWLDLRCK